MAVINASSLNQNQRSTSFSRKIGILLGSVVFFFVFFYKIYFVHHEDAYITRNTKDLSSLSKNAEKEYHKTHFLKKTHQANTGSNNNGVNCSLTSVDCIRDIVNQHPVVVFEKPYCPYCKAALETLKLEGVDPFIIDLQDWPQNQGPDKAVQQTLRSMTGRYTVPNVFIGGASIGGGDETVALHRNGSLKEKLREAKAI